MTDTWEEALDHFLQPWLKKKEVIGIFATGSMVQGTATPRSDIDVHIVTENGIDWRERGNKIVSNWLIEYFVNPVERFDLYEKEEEPNNSRSIVRNVALSRILYDPTSLLVEMKTNAEQKLAEPFTRPDKNTLEAMKYSLWDSLDGLLDLKDLNDPSYRTAFHHHQQYVYQTYCKFLGTEIATVSKQYRLLADKQFAEKYSFPKFPDKQFVNDHIQLLQMEELTDLEELTGYVLNQMGGFTVDGWKLRTPAFNETEEKLR